MCALLTWVVERALEGDTEALGGYRIGVAVYERPDDFDPRTDTLVRVEMARLRRLLDRYHADTGSPDVRIDVPKGGYLPKFTFDAQPSKVDPPALLPGENVEWLEGDENTARAKLKLDGFELEVVYKVDADGRVVSVRADRWGDQNSYAMIGMGGRTAQGNLGRAGDTISHLAEDYGVEQSKIEDLVRKWFGPAAA